MTIGYPRKKVIRARSLKNGSILYAYEDFELRNEVTVTFPIEGIFQKIFIRSQSAKNGLTLYEDFELRNEVTVTFPIEGIFQNFLILSFLIPIASRLRRGII